MLSLPAKRSEFDPQSPHIKSCDSPTETPLKLLIFFSGIQVETTHWGAALAREMHNEAAESHRDSTHWAHENMLGRGTHYELYSRRDFTQGEHFEVPHCLNKCKKKGNCFRARKESSSFFRVPQAPPINKDLTVSQLTKSVCFQCPAPVLQRKIRLDSEALRE